ncbi:DUF6489 family protein [uncultured Erythrobacter sp.]|uniref:DUF6489 family protein n=1 Tax=uncultured Erythrobacter sp. TaxID=263913 RepID=UPI00261A9A04|nr:DUF6489 family protein [uncultured Erythrobacter sp.]
MKINVEIECTPEEARTFMGLPDVSQANSVYVDNIAKAMKGVNSPDQLQEYAQALAPMGQVGLKLFQSFVEGGMRASSPRSNSDSDKSSD